MIESLELEKGLDATQYVKYCKDNNISTKDKSIAMQVIRVHLMRYGVTNSWYEFAKKHNLKTKKQVEDFYFNELVDILKENKYNKKNEEGNMEVITIDFSNIISEFKNKKLNIVLLKNRNSIFIEDKENNLYCIDKCFVGSYLDKLILEGEKISFYIQDAKIGKEIDEWEVRDRLNFKEVKDFIKNQSEFWSKEEKKMAEKIIQSYVKESDNRIELPIADLSNINEDVELKNVFDSVKLVNGYYLPITINFEKSYDGEFYTFSFNVDENFKSQTFISGNNESGKMKITTNFKKFNGSELKSIEKYIQNRFDEFIENKNINNIETLKDYIIIKHKEIKKIFFNNSTNVIFNIRLDELISSMLIDEIKIRNKKGYRLEAYTNDKKYIEFINSIVDILKNKNDVKTFDIFLYQELMSIINDLKYDDKLIKKYNNKFIGLKENIENNKIIISSPQNTNINMNLQLLANKGLVNTINEAFIYDLNDFDDYVLDTEHNTFIKQCNLKGNKFNLNIIPGYKLKEVKCGKNKIKLIGYNSSLKKVESFKIDLDNSNNYKFKTTELKLIIENNYQVKGGAIFESGDTVTISEENYYKIHDRYRIVFENKKRGLLSYNKNEESKQWLIEGENLIIK